MGISGKKCIILHPEIPNMMSYPIGQSDCKLDSKGRLMVPASFKEQLGALCDEGFVMRPGLFGNCIELYTTSDWNRTQDKLKKLNTFVRANVEFIRKYNAGAHPVKLDASGRLQIPKDLLEKCGLQKDVVLASLTANMEIWDKDTYYATIGAMDETTFEQLATEKLSDLTFEE